MGARKRSSSQPADAFTVTPHRSPRARVESRDELWIWLRRHGVGSFWLPIVLLFLLCSPDPRWCALNSLILVSFFIILFSPGIPPPTLNLSQTLNEFYLGPVLLYCTLCVQHAEPRGSLQRNKTHPRSYGALASFYSYPCRS